MLYFDTQQPTFVIPPLTPASPAPASNAGGFGNPVLAAMALGEDSETISALTAIQARALALQTVTTVAFSLLAAISLYKFLKEL